MSSPAEVVYGTNALRDLFAGIRDVIGGRTGSYEKVFEKGQQKAIEELKQRAQKLNADAANWHRKLIRGQLALTIKECCSLITATGYSG